MTDKVRQVAVFSLQGRKEGEKLRIVSISKSSGIHQQLAQMGIHVGDTIRVKRCVPFGGPILIESRGSAIALSKGYAEKIKVELMH